MRGRAPSDLRGSFREVAQRRSCIVAAPRILGHHMSESPAGKASVVRMLHCDENVALAETGALFVAIWRGSVTRNAFERQRAGLADVVQRHPRGAAFLCLVELTAKPPDEELRRAASDMVRSHGKRLTCVATVVEGDGFTAAVHRGAVTGIAMLRFDRKTPMSVFATVREAVMWLRDHVALPQPDELISTIEYVRARLPSPRSDR